VGLALGGSRLASSELVRRAQLLVVTPKSTEFEQVATLGVGPYEAVRRVLPVAGLAQVAHPAGSAEAGAHGGGLGFRLRWCILGSAPTAHSLVQGVRLVWRGVGG
jgi:hypothetical protein